MAVKWLCLLLVPVLYFFIVVEDTDATVIIKQEKMDETPVVPEHEKALVSCFCPHGFSTATLGHYHCRYCGHSSHCKKTIMRHEKVHRNFQADEAVTSKQRHCGFLSRYMKNLCWREKSKRAKSRPVMNKQVLQPYPQRTAVGTGVRLETTANRLRVSI